MARTLTLDPSERGFICGDTGEGKSEFAKWLLREWQRRHWRIAIMDPKHDWMGKKPQWEQRGPGTIDRPRLVTRFNPRLAVQCYQPDIPAWKDPAFNQFCDDILTAEDTVVYCDELDGVATGNSIAPGFSRLWTQGRAKCVAVWSGSQRPFRIPEVCKSQANWWVCFYVHAPRDRSAVAEYTATPEVAHLLPAPHAYWLWHKGERQSAHLMKPLPLKTSSHGKAIAAHGHR